MKLGRYIIGLLGGLTFGMLFAPKKGHELRKEICQKGSQSHMEGLKALGEAFRGAGEEAVKELRHLAEHEDVAALLDISKEKMRSFLDAAQEKGYDAASYVQGKLEGLADMAKERAEEVKGSAEQFQRRAVRKAEGIQKRVVAKIARVKKVSKGRKAKRS
jgi:gas vesicle protein